MILLYIYTIFLLIKLTQYDCKTWDGNDETSKMNQISNAMKYWKHQSLQIKKLFELQLN